MVFLFKIWIFKIDFTILVSFLFGIVVGVIMVCLIYAILVLLSLRDKKYQVKVQANDLKATEAEEMIRIAQKSFQDNDLRGDLTKIAYFKTISTDLVYGIASRFYPDSKRPLMELTIDECIELIGYIQIRLNDILDKKALRLLRKMKIADIVNLTKATTAVVDSKAFEVTKTVNKAVTIGRKILNSVNPMWWTKKAISTVVISTIMRKLYLVTLGIIGEEAYKIYSKSYKNKAEEIDSNVSEITDNIGTEILSNLKEEAGLDLGDNNPKKEEKKELEKKFKTRIVVSGEKESDPYKSIYDKQRKQKERKEIPLEIIPFDEANV